MKKRAVLLFLIALLSLLTVTGCTRGSNASDPELDAEDPAETVVIRQYDYRLFQDTVEYITEEEMEAWRPHLLRRFSYIQDYTEEDVPEGEYAIGAFPLYALFDLNLDGVPEILGGFPDFGSGFAPVYAYSFSSAYDLYTGEELETHSFSICDGTAVYYDMEMGCYKIFSVNYESTRMGMERFGGCFSIERIESLYTSMWNPRPGDTPCFVSTTYLSTNNGAQAMISAETDAEDPDYRRTVWLYGEPSYTKDGEPCSYFEFFNELVNFSSNQVLIPATRLQFIRLPCGEYGITAEDILALKDGAVDELLSGGQKFVRPIVREETDMSEVTE